MTNLSDILLVTDLDDTLLSSDKTISQGNKAAIDRFIEMGGGFTIATGRGYQMALPIAKSLPLTQPAILYNGAAIYDFTKDEFLWSCALPETARGTIRDVIERFPQIGVEALIGRDVYVLNMNEIERKHLALEGIKYTECSVDEAPEGWIKVLFTVDDVFVPEFARYLKTNHAEGVSYIQSSPNYYEMLPPNISKGTACKRLLTLTATHTKYAAIGDYNNDAEMVRLANFGFAVANAVDEVKGAARYIVSDCNHDPIEEMVRQIMKDIKTNRI